MRMAATTADLDDKDHNIRNFIIESDGAFAGTAEVAEAFDMTTQGASYRLEKLRSHNKVEGRVVSRDEVWYVPEDDESPEPDGGITIACFLASPLWQNTSESDVSFWP